MKLTQEIKTELDGYSSTKLVSLFRFFPSDYTTGETGKYIQKIAVEKRRKESMSGSDTSERSDTSSNNSPFGSPK